jgi:uncharacterized protein YqhQ
LEEAEAPQAEKLTAEAVLQYGGQAVIEGVMMRSKHYFAVACRRPDGQIIVQREEVDKSFLGKLKWLNKPFLRGTLALIDAMALGSRALSFASNVQLQYEQELKGRTAVVVSPTEKAREEFRDSAASLANGIPMVVSETAPKSGRINDIAIGSSLAFSLVFGVVLFVLIPTLLTDKLGKYIHLTQTGVSHSDVWRNISDGLIKMVIFFGYISLISFMGTIRRVFQYHGAEHKAINTLEAGLPLDTRNALAASRIHPRCGTSFIFVVLVVNLIVFAFLPRPVWYLRFPLHLAVIPLVAGVAYEIIKFAGKFRRNPLVMAVFAPGMATQYLTTREPDASQIEVALAALYSVMEAEGHLPVTAQADPPEPVTA